MRISKVKCANGHMRMDLNKVKGFHKWIEALRSDGFKQTREKLGSCEDGFCCLGVANHIQTGRKDFLNSGVPEKKTNASSWLIKVNKDFEKSSQPEDYYPFGGVELAELNDNNELSFQEIADCLEAVYIDGVLDA